MPQHFESAEYNADFKGLMGRFDIYLDKDDFHPDKDSTVLAICDKEKTCEGTSENDGGGNVGEKEKSKSPMRSRTLEIKESIGRSALTVNQEGGENCVPAEKINMAENEGGRKTVPGASMDDQNDHKGDQLGIQGIYNKQTEGGREGIEFLAQKNKGKKNIKSSEKKERMTTNRNEMDVNDDYSSDSDDIYIGPPPVRYQPDLKKTEIKQEPVYDKEGYSEDDESTDTDESDDTSSEDEEMRTIRRYGGLPKAPSTSSRMDVAAATKVSEATISRCEELDKDIKKGETDFLEWIHMRVMKLHDSKAAARYDAMGVVGRLAYDLAELNAMSKIHKDVIVEMVNRDKRNQELMKEIEERRIQELENDRVYAEAMAKTRQSSKHLSDARIAEHIAEQRNHTASGYLDTGVISEKRAKKRKPLEAPETLLFGRKSEKVAKRLRNNRFMSTASWGGVTGVTGVAGEETNGGGK